MDALTYYSHFTPKQLHPKSSDMAKIFLWRFLRSVTYQRKLRWLHWSLAETSTAFQVNRLSIIVPLGILCKYYFLKSYIYHSIIFLFFYFYSFIAVTVVTISVLSVVIKGFLNLCLVLQVSTICKRDVQ